MLVFGIIKKVECKLRLWCTCNLLVGSILGCSDCVFASCTLLLMLPLLMMPVLFLPLIVGRSLNSEGLIAPGMHASFSVAFSPNSLGNYHEEMKVGNTHIKEGSHLPLPFFASSYSLLDDE